MKLSKITCYWNTAWIHSLGLIRHDPARAILYYYYYSNLIGNLTLSLQKSIISSNSSSCSCCSKTDINNGIHLPLVSRHHRPSPPPPPPRDHPHLRSPPSLRRLSPFRCCHHHLRRRPRHHHHHPHRSRPPAPPAVRAARRPRSRRQGRRPRLLQQRRLRPLAQDLLRVHRRRQQGPARHPPRPLQDRRKRHPDAQGRRHPLRRHRLRRRLRHREPLHPPRPRGRHRLRQRHLRRHGLRSRSQRQGRALPGRSRPAQIRGQGPREPRREVRHRRVPRRSDTLPAGESGGDDRAPGIAGREEAGAELRAEDVLLRPAEEDRGAVPGALQGHEGIPPRGEGRGAGAGEGRVDGEEEGVYQHPVLFRQSRRGRSGRLRGLTEERMENGESSTGELWEVGLESTALQSTGMRLLSCPWNTAAACITA